jgi:hypothetical protein
MASNFVRTSSQYLTAGNSPVSDPPITMACWFKTDDVTFTANYTLLGLQNTSNGHRMNLFFRPQTSDLVSAATTVGAAIGEALSTSSVVANTWHHVCGVFTSNSSRTVYLNGGNNSTDTFSVTPTYGPATIGIGARHNGSSWALFAQAEIAECGIWDVALTAAEIASLADGMTCDKVRPQNLRFYAPLVRNLQDVRGGLTITNNNTATVANHPRVYA